MKILLQTYNTFAQNPGGGVQTRITNLYNEYKRQGHIVDLFDKWTTKIDEYDLIHFFKVTVDNYGLMVYAKSKGLKIVVSSVIPLAQSFRIRFHLLLNRIFPLHTIFDIQKRCLDLSDIIIAQSNTECEFIRRNYNIPPHKLTALPNGVATQLTECQDVDVDLPFQGDFVLQVGRVDSNKNQLNTIKALKGTGIPLVIVGGADPQEPAYMEKCKEVADDMVYFTGWIPISDPRLKSLYKSAKVLVLPSKKEIYGNVIVEGGISGCNLACSNVIPITDWNIGQYIRTFNPDSIEDIREKLIAAFKAPLIDGQSEEFRTFFSWERVAKEHIEIYKKLIYG